MKIVAPDTSIASPSTKIPPLLVAEALPDRKHPEPILTKRFEADGTKHDYDAGWLYRYHEFPITTFAELVDVLEMLTEQPAMCVLRGVQDPEAPEVCYRRKHDRVNKQTGEIESANLLPAAFPWVVYDFDDTTAPFDVGAPVQSIRAWHSTLPPELRAAESAFFISSSAHYWPTVRGKLVVWYRSLISEAQACAMALYYGADKAVCYCHQPNYFAAPLFADGAVDRAAALRHQPVMFGGKPAHMPARADMKRFKDRPPPKGVPLKDLPAGDQGILAALGPAAEQVGRRFWMCGQLGGIMRKLGFRREACAAVLREWLAELPTAGIEHGVTWALQAWDKPADAVSGEVALRETVGKAHADVIVGACLRARRPARLIRIGGGL